MPINNEEITTKELHDIWFQQFATLANSSGVDQTLIAEAMLTVAISRMFALTPNAMTVSMRLAELAGGMAQAAVQAPPIARH